MLNVIIKDLAGDNNYYLKLSEEQYRLLEWLVKKDMLADVRVEIFEEYEFKKIWKEQKQWLQRKKHQQKSHLKKKE